ncbi:hypothetical protein POM88_005054 [Heracleum sosnowskyi]|uniref:Uncharacterized protein n=1 Tax=Heracleum sosnowskyi TaxID=360622 RepID=A0AAD8JL64_9APIA|nr:hypothetical protein POM88_005054 [Heracleum sosnowskyi]
MGTNSGLSRNQHRILIALKLKELKEKRKRNQHRISIALKLKELKEKRKRTSISGFRVGQQFPNPATRDEHVIVPIAQVYRISGRTTEKNVFRSNVKAPIASGTFESEKRKISNGPNPLHTKR